MVLSTRPFLILYVVWHPAFDEGRSIAKKLYEHYRRELYSNVAGGAGLSVIYRQAPDPTTSMPAAIDLSEGETSAVVLLIDEGFAGDANYVAWTKSLLTQTETVGLSARVFPVAIASDATRLGIAEQAVRWDRWATLEADARLRRLTSDLTYQFCRMLRSYLEHLLRPNEEAAALEQYLKKVQVFLSHSKHDADGGRIARQIRQRIFDGDGLASFFDVHDIPTGVRFDTSALAASQGQRRNCAPHRQLLFTRVVSPRNHRSQAMERASGCGGLHLRHRRTWFSLLGERSCRSNGSGQGRSN